MEKYEVVQAINEAMEPLLVEIRALKGKVDAVRFAANALVFANPMPAVMKHVWDNAVASSIAVAEQTRIGGPENIFVNAYCKAYKEGLNEITTQVHSVAAAHAAHNPPSDE